MANLEPHWQLVRNPSVVDVLSGLRKDPESGWQRATAGRAIWGPRRDPLHDKEQGFAQPGRETTDGRHTDLAAASSTSPIRSGLKDTSRLH
jgi:hypothetical protein